MGIYKSTQIQAAIDNGSIVCVPFDAQKLGPASLRLSLGAYYYKAEQASEALVHNPLDREDNERYFEGPFHALTHEQQYSLSGLKLMEGLAPDRPIIPLGPGERIVAHTHEFIGLSPGDKIHLEELPGWHQNGVIVAANFEEVAGITRLSLVIHNMNAYKVIMLPVGAPIAQLVLYRASSQEQTTGPEVRLGTAEVDAAISTWTPSSILAKAIPIPAELPPKIQGLSYE